MPRPLTGKLRVKQLSDGRRAFYARVAGVERLIGQEPHWTATTAGHELRERIVPAAKLGQKWWEGYGGAAPAPAAADIPTLHEIASDLIAAQRLRSTNANTRNAFEAPLRKHVLPFMAYYDGGRTLPRPMTDVTPVLIDQLIATKVRERETLRDLADSLAELEDQTLRDDEQLRRQLDSEEFDLLCRYGQRSRLGKRSLSSRGLSNQEINKCLDRIRAVVRLANTNHRLGLLDPTEDKRLPKRDPLRVWLRPDQLQAIFEAADELDARSKRYSINRGRIVRVLALGGPRVTELGGMSPSDVLLDENVIMIPESKTTAGQRDLHMHRAVRWVVEAALDDGGAWLFPTEAGTRRDRHNIRERVLAPVLELATEFLAERGQRPLPGTALPDGRRVPGRVTPHTFRRTYLTYLAWAGRPQSFAMGQAGHRSADLTLEIYQQKPPATLDPRVEMWLED